MQLKSLSSREMSAWKLGFILPTFFRPSDCAWFHDVALTISLSGKSVMFATFATL